MKQPSTALIEPQACPQWVERLNAIHSDDLSFEERLKLRKHLEVCPRCQAVKAEYRSLDALIIGLPPVAPLTQLPARLQELIGASEETTLLLSENDLIAWPALAPCEPAPVHQRPPQRRLGSVVMKLNLAAAVLMVAALVGGFLVLRTGLYPGSAGSPQTAVYLFGMAPNDASQPVAYALDPSTGSTVWQQNVDKNRIGNASVVANGSIYYSSSDGTISALNARNGQPLWHTKLTPDQTPPALVSFSGGPLAYGNLLIVTTTSGDLYALKASTGTISWKNTIQGCSAPDNQWGSSPLTQTAPLPSTACTLFSMVQSNGILYGLVGTHSSVNRHLAGLYAWDETDGHALWHNPQYVATGPALTPIVASPRKIYLPSNENSVNVFSGIDVLDASTGQFLHHLQTGSPINEMIAPDATTLYALDGNNMLSAYRLSDETLLWQKYTAPLISEMSVTNDNVYLVSSNQAYSHATDLFTLSSRTGDQLWRWHGSQEGAAAPIEVNGVVCMSTTDGVYAFQFDTGHLLWHFPGAGMYEMISG